MPTFEKTTELPCSPEELWTYHARAGALQRLTPPFERMRGLVEVPSLTDGARAVLEIAVGPVWTQWVAVHERVVPGRGFVDVMERGPFKSWRHEHIFEPHKGGCILVDRITFEPPGGPVGAGVVSAKLARSFAFRHQTTRLDLELQRALPASPLVVGVSGASGLIGRELTSLLRVLGHTVRRFARGSSANDAIRWDPSTGALGAGAEDLDAVVHLAGEPIGDKRLDDAQQRRVRESRVDATEKLVASLAALAAPATQGRRLRAFISSSAVGFYGSRGDEVLTEEAAPGRGILAELCADWERAASKATSAGMRVAMSRTGVVLSPAGGALERMLPPFRAGLGARLGEGRQWMPVIAVDDVAAMLYRAIVDERVQGPFNAVGPEPLTNERFTHLLGRVLGRPAPFAVPRFAAKALFGGALVDEALLASQRAVPSRMFAWGHAFRHSTAEDALRHVLGRPDTTHTRPSSSPPPPGP